MSLAKLKQWTRKLFSAGAATRRRNGIQPRLEALEDRLVPATRVWDGGAVLNDRWTDARNWAGNVAPVEADDLVFPTGIGALDRTTNNDFPTDTLFKSITFSGDDYELSGNRITIGTGGVVSEGQAVSNTINFDIRIAGSPFDLDSMTFTVADGQLLQMFGSISSLGQNTGPSFVRNLFKRGEGTLTFAGSTPNTIRGVMVVDEGTLALAKSPGLNVFADDLVLRGTSNVLVVNSNQIPDDHDVHFLELTKLQFIGGSSDAFNNLFLTGGTVDTGAGTLTLNGVISTFPTNTTAVINGKLNLGSTTHTFVVQDGAAGNDLIINAVISGAGGGFEKVDQGVLILNGNNTYTGQTVINGGDLRINGNQPNSNILLNAGILSGTGQVGQIFATGGAVDPASFGVTGVLATRQLSMQAGSTLVVSLGDQVHNTTITAVLNGLPTLDVRSNVRSRVGDSFRIVDNDAKAVIGIFKDTLGNPLTEGAVLDVGGRAFQISYVGGPIGDVTDIVITHVNTAPMFQNRQVTSPIKEGGRATVTGTIVEPDTLDTFFLDVTWGDGSAPQTFKFLPGTPRDIDVSHRYLDNGDYTINLLWRDQHGAFNTGTLAVHVDNVAPRLGDVSISSPVVPGQRAVLTGSIVDPGRRDTFTLVVDWGDGTTPETIQLRAGSERFALTHRYAKAGHYQVTLTLTDDDGGTTDHSIGVKVKSWPFGD